MNQPQHKYPRYNFTAPLNFGGKHYLGISMAPGVNYVGIEPMPCVAPPRNRLVFSNNSISPNVFVEHVSSPDTSFNVPDGYLAIEAVVPFVPPAAPAAT